MPRATDHVCLAPPLPARRWHGPPPPIGLRSPDRSALVRYDGRSRRWRKAASRWISWPWGRATAWTWARAASCDPSRSSTGGSRRASRGGVVGRCARGIRHGPGAWDRRVAECAALALPHPPRGYPCPPGCAGLALVHGGGKGSFQGRRARVLSSGLSSSGAPWAGRRARAGCSSASSRREVVRRRRFG